MLQCGFNFVDRYIEMLMRRVHLSMRTEGIKAFSKRIRRCSVDGENGRKTISVDANLFENGAKQFRIRLKTEWCGQGLIPYIPCDCGSCNGPIDT